MPEAPHRPDTARTARHPDDDIGRGDDWRRSPDRRFAIGPDPDAMAPVTREQWIDTETMLGLRCDALMRPENMDLPACTSFVTPGLRGLVA